MCANKVYSGQVILLYSPPVCKSHDFYVVFLNKSDSNFYIRPQGLPPCGLIYKALVRG